MLWFSNLIIIVLILLTLPNYLLPFYYEMYFDSQKCHHYSQITLCEKCPNTKFFLVRTFPYSSWIRRFTESIFVFSKNTGKYGPEKISHLDTFQAVLCIVIQLNNILILKNSLSFSWLILSCEHPWQPWIGL